MQGIRWIPIRLGAMPTAEAALVGTERSPEYI